ncbi:MAG: hypothetical protein M3R38_34690 [Actinomycetota bacterium]|nr:hypothetical protein [Actinomycetota bacterium]
MFPAAVEALGIDHVQVAVRDLERSEALYDRTMPGLGFRKRKAVSRAPIPAANRSGPPFDHTSDNRHYPLYNACSIADNATPSRR